MLVAGLVLGMFLGVFFGLLIAGLCAAAARGTGEWNDLEEQNAMSAAQRSRASARSS
jgi:hypothetical protein